MSYQRERGECIAQLTKYGLEYWRIETLLRCATTINRLAELACSSEAADRDRVKCPAWVKWGRYVADMPEQAEVLQSARVSPYPCLCDVDHDGIGLDGNPASVHTKIPRISLQDYRAEVRAFKAVPDGWTVLTSGDPREYTLHVVPPAYAEENKGRDRHNLRSIGVPPGPSGLRF